MPETPRDLRLPDCSPGRERTRAPPVRHSPPALIARPASTAGRVMAGFAIQTDFTEDANLVTTARHGPGLAPDPSVKGPRFHAQPKVKRFRSEVLLHTASEEPARHQTGEPAVAVIRQGRTRYCALLPLVTPHAVAWMDISWITLIGVPSGTRSYRSMTSWFSRRMQPEETALPIDHASGVPCRR